jgi:hypothetical protein
VEIEGCIEDFRRELGIRPQHFAFPYNRHAAPRRELVRSSGLRTAMGSGESPLITRDADMYALARLETPQSLTRVRFCTSGAYPGLPRALLGRAA